MWLKPLSNRVVVQRVESVSQTAGGILIPDGATEKADQGTVVSVGPGERHPVTGEVIPVPVNVNDRVLFGKTAGHTVKIDGQELLVLKEEEILGIVQ